VFVQPCAVVLPHHSNVDGVWYADDETGHEDDNDGKFRSLLIAPHHAHLRKPAYYPQYVYLTV